MKMPPIVEAITPTHACLTASFGAGRGPMQPSVIMLPPAEPANTPSAEISPFEEKPNCSLARCPQGADCAGESELARLFDCEQGCGFSGCGACMSIHESEPHASDADVMLAMFRNIGGSW
jgi:hypothetical protein